MSGVKERWALSGEAWLLTRFQARCVLRFSIISPVAGLADSDSGINHLSFTERPFYSSADGVKLSQSVVSTNDRSICGRSR